MTKVSSYKCLDAANGKTARTVSSIQWTIVHIARIEISSIIIAEANRRRRPAISLNAKIAESTRPTVTVPRGGEVITAKQKQSFLKHTSTESKDSMKL